MSFIFQTLKGLGWISGLTLWALDTPELCFVELPRCSLKKPLMRSLLDYSVTNKHRWHEQMDGHVNHGTQHQNKTKTQLMRMELWVWDRTFSSWFLRTGFWEIILNSVGTRKVIYPFKWGGINAMLCNLVYTWAAPKKKNYKILTPVSHLERSWYRYSREHCGHQDF